MDGFPGIKEPARWAALPTCSDWRQVAWKPPVPALLHQNPKLNCPMPNAQCPMPNPQCPILTI
ncbi:MAG: hypothetical protein V7L05_33125 [Nostoc sp.]|uniref:hypothetical protein n=1 Tax=Nostoc sp. TaxID=1180 RepID=UPI002FF8A590